MAYKALPPQERLRQLFDYNPTSGELHWKTRQVEDFGGTINASEHTARRWNTRFAGKPAGSCGKCGYIEIRINKERLLAHRVIWKLVHGVDPDDVDHINGDGSDNRLANLRNVSHQDNGRNMKLNKRNTSGCPGVYWDGRRRGWVARVHVDYRNKHLGQFTNFDEAVAARRAAEVALGFHENHGQR